MNRVRTSGDYSEIEKKVSTSGLLPLQSALAKPQAEDFLIEKLFMRKYLGLVHVVRSFF